VTPVLDRVGSLPQQLRVGSADLHAAVESVADLPASVQTLGDYGDLLSAFYDAHRQVEASLDARERDLGWPELGIDLGSHRQLNLLTDDLAVLGLTPAPRPLRVLAVDDPAEALGWVYVVEGSAIGRRVLAPMLKERLGDIPTAFFDGVGRDPHVWRDVQRALTSWPADPVRQRAVLAGARTAFGIFLGSFHRRAERRNRSRR
jgi:heme oxygenase